MSLLKEASVESDRVWKAAGKPRNGPIFAKRQSCRLSYRKGLNISNLISSKTGVYIVLYADYILLIAPSVHVADQLLKSVERELIILDMVINAKHHVVYALAQGVTLPVALYLLHLESKFHGRVKYGILVLLLSNVVNLNVV